LGHPVLERYNTWPSVEVVPTAAAYKPACIEPAVGNRLADTIACVDQTQTTLSQPPIRRPLPSPTPLVGCAVQWYNVGPWPACFSCPALGLDK